MNPQALKLSMIARSNLVKFAVGCLIAAFVIACTSSTALAANKKKKKVNYGQLEIATNPGGFPMRIDGQPQGDTSQTVRVIELQPGHHVVQVDLPNGQSWVRDFDIAEGRKVCVNLNYHPRQITTPKSPCPFPVNLSAPSTVNDGDLITFTSDVSYSGTAPLNYAWTVSPAAARIVSGAGTSTITVDSTGLGGQRVTATLAADDGSGDPMCRQTAQASTNVVAKTPPPVECRQFDQFPSVAFDDDKARFDNLAIELQNSPDATAYIIIYAGQHSRTGQADALGKRSMDYLTITRGVGAQRLVFVNGGYREQDQFEIWLCPPGAHPPQPTPTVQPGDVQPAPDRTRPRKPRHG
ncbi:MAG TPA: hypothetical protein VE961_26395 [Pyrinomonadaceae bacterium]|nr:hypothetical protein [Pyrinomonadaceae bacterium]